MKHFSGKQQIVIAFVTVDMEPAQKTWRHDLGERPKMKEVLVAKAAMWLREGDEDDMRKALRHAEQNDGTVHVFPLSESDPLEKARKEALAIAKKARAAQEVPVEKRKSAGHILFGKEVEYFRVGNDVYVGQRHNPLADANGTRRHGRWECSYDHFKTYQKNGVYPKRTSA